MLDNFNVNLRKNKGFLTYTPYIPIPEFGQSNAPQISRNSHEPKWWQFKFSLFVFILLG